MKIQLISTFLFLFRLKEVFKPIWNLQNTISEIVISISSKNKHIYREIYLKTSLNPIKICEPL